MEPLTLTPTVQTREPLREHGNILTGSTPSPDARRGEDDKQQPGILLGKPGRDHRAGDVVKPSAGHNVPLLDLGGRFPTWGAPPASPRTDGVVPQGETLSEMPSTTQLVPCKRAEARRPPQTGKAGSRRPPQPTSPRARMSEYLFHTSPHSPTRVPLGFQAPRSFAAVSSSSPCLSPRGLAGDGELVSAPGNRSPTECRSPCTSPRMSPRGLAGDGAPRKSLADSNACLAYLRKCQTDKHVEDMIDDKLASLERAERASKDGCRMQDVRFTRERLRNPQYRNATMCATSLARRSKPAQQWR